MINEDAESAARRGSKHRPWPMLLKPGGITMTMVIFYLLAKRAAHRAYGWGDQTAAIERGLLMLVLVGLTCFAGFSVLKEMTMKSRRRLRGIIWGMASMFGAAAPLGDPLNAWDHPHPSGMNQCINNLRYIDSAKQEWAFNNNKRPDDVPTPSDLVPYLSRDFHNLPCCPRADSTNFDESYSINALKAKPACKLAPDIHVLP